MGTKTEPVSTKGFTGRTYYRKASKLPEEIVETLVRRYYLSNSQLSQLGWDEYSERVALPVFNSDSELLGCVLRSESGASPKALSYVEENAVGIFRNYSSDVCIIVEDLYSALRASEYVNAAAILGTYLNQERIDTLQYLRCKKYYLALDADAFDKTIKYVQQYRSSLPMIPMKISKDLKNMDEEELKKLIEEL